jgi:cytochrome P450
MTLGEESLRVSEISEPPTESMLTYPAARAHPFDPPPEYGRLRREDPVSKVRLVDGREAWLVTRYDDARTVLADGRFSSDRRHPAFPITVQGRGTISKAPPLMITMDGEEHAAARRAVLSEFTVKRTNALRPRIQQIADEFIGAMFAGPRPVDLVEALALPVPALVTCEQLGVPFTDHDFFQKIVMKVVNHRTPEEERNAATLELRSYLGELVAAKELNPTDDLLGRQILKIRAEGGEIDRPALVGLAWLLLVAGLDTTSGMISLGVLALLEHPEQLAVIRADPAKTPMAIEELLRYFTVVEHVTSRVATADVEIGGCPVRKDEAVIVAGPAADRDESVFPDPDRLDIGRGARNHLAFGYGPHQCIGANLARAELQIVYDTLFRRIPDLRLAVDFADLPFKYDANFYGLFEMPVTW